MYHVESRCEMCMYDLNVRLIRPDHNTQQCLNDIFEAEDVNR